ncbi:MULTISPECIES: PepSY domain-containing protein [unclassified Neisseria]|uniref:PepSY domain-containing protein n=1 Tax=unclassified Neisseria TaxID=2623750 RepID=UPI00266689FF|nr:MULTISPECIES: PepSY domain-containing protein [unclassified Neisseria]MDO1510730.1 PepSY domain-containing protein [Neisseria sp. MVDL19-042950]MDO1517020.1 PepSY domain-containing protein [Neisseria sp. MVDL18-041461]MDO1564382.1 PepSY domain-containing protein [Neisseria sp. MVDL20-010259]
MITTRKIFNGIAFLAALSVVGGALIAAFSFGLFAPVSGKEAAANAVAQTGGYAKEVEFEYDYHTGGRYEVEVLADGLKHKVIVDADDGKVLGVHTKGHKKYHYHSNNMPVQM